MGRARHMEVSARACALVRESGREEDWKGGRVGLRRRVHAHAYAYAYGSMRVQGRHIGQRRPWGVEGMGGRGPWDSATCICCVELLSNLSHGPV